MIAELEGYRAEMERMKKNPRRPTQAYLQRVEDSNKTIAINLAIAFDHPVSYFMDLLNPERPADKEMLHKIIVARGWKMIDPSTHPEAEHRRFFLHSTTMPRGYALVLTKDHFVYMYNGYCYNVYEDKLNGLWDVQLDELVKAGGQKQVICYWIPAEYTEETVQKFVDRCIQRKVEKYGRDWIKNPNQKFKRTLVESREDLLREEAKVGKRDSQQATD